MLTKSNKKTSRTVLFALTAAFIIILPIISSTAKAAGMYIVFSIMALLSAWRIYETKRIALSGSITAFSLFTLYAVLCGVFCSDSGGQLQSVMLMFMLLMTAFLSADYFENIGENSDRKLMYLMAASGVCCAVLNIFVWLLQMVPLGEYSAFRAGIGQNDALGAFMAIGILFCIFLKKGAGKSRATKLYAMLVPMAFVLIMTKSICAFILMAALFIAMKNKKAGKRAAAISIILVVICALIFILGNHQAFCDAFLAGIKRPFGLGGGGYLARQEEYMGSYYPKVSYFPFIARVVSDFGVFGLAFSIFLVFRYAALMKKILSPKTVSSFCVLLFVLFAPFKNEYAVLVFLTGFLTYAEASYFKTYSVKKKNLLYAVNILCILSLLSGFLFGHSLLKMRADAEYKSENYSSAYILYKNAAMINVCDSESCLKALASLRKSDMAIEKSEQAHTLMKKAQWRSRGSVDAYVEKARYYGACSDYINAADNWRIVLMKAPHNYKYNISFVKLLYKKIKDCEKGSPEAKKVYNEISEVSEKTQNIDAKKIINDIRDKALIYTKSELKAPKEKEIDAP